MINALSHNSSLDKISDNPELSLHIDLVKFYLEIFKKEPIYRACAIVGSFAKGSADRISDIDMIVFVTDKKAKAFEIIRDIEPFSQVEKFVKKHDDTFYFKKTIFENFVRCGSACRGERLFFRLGVPYIALFDHDNFLEGITDKGDPPGRRRFSRPNKGR